MSGEAEIILNPGEVAKRLGVSPSGLRRLAGVYGQLYGDLPKDSSGTSRLWPQEAVVRLEAARALMASGQARSIKDALRALEQGATPTADAVLTLGQDGRILEALGVVSAQLKALQDSNSELRAEVAALRERAALPGEGEGLGATASAGSPGDLPAPAHDDGPLVRLARRLERVFRRASG